MSGEEKKNGKKFNSNENKESTEERCKGAKKKIYKKKSHSKKKYKKSSRISQREALERSLEFLHEEIVEKCLKNLHELNFQTYDDHEDSSNMMLTVSPNELSEESQDEARAQVSRITVVDTQKKTGDELAKKETEELTGRSSDEWTEEWTEKSDNSQNSQEENACAPGPSKRKVRRKTKSYNELLKTMASLIPSHTDLMEENVVFHAIYSDNYNLLKVLLEQGNVKGEITWRETGETALLAAIRKDNLRMFHLLIAYGADINACLSPGKNCLYFASGRNNYEMVEYMCNVYKQSGPNWPEGYPALFAASAMGHLRIVDLLISSGVDLEAKTEGFLTPLHIAIERGYMRITELLLKRGFDVNQTTAEGYSVLHYAVKRESMVLIKLFLDAGADMALKSNKGESPFYLAIHTGKVEIVEMFCDYGVDVHKF